MNKQQIHQAFLDTTYRVLMNPIIDISINKTIPELDNLNSWAFLTAWNPLSVILTEAENKLRNVELEDDLKAIDLKYNIGIGFSHDEKWNEESFFIKNCTLEKANELAAKYRQLAFVWGEKNKTATLVYTQN